MMPLEEEWFNTHNEIISIIEKPKELDISEADVIVAVGRGYCAKEDLENADKLADLLNGIVACSRPMVEANLFDARHQIGLSGKTVKPKLIITLGISGAIQFTSGMNGSDCIIAVNTDPKAQIFDVATYGIVGDAKKIVPELIEKIKEDR